MRCIFGCYFFIYLYIYLICVSHLAYPKILNDDNNNNNKPC